MLASVLRRELRGLLRKGARCLSTKSRDTEEQLVQLVWPPPGRFPFGGLQSTSDKWHPERVPSSSEDREPVTLSRAAEDAEIEEDLPAKTSILELLKTHGIPPGSLSRSTLQKLPIKLLREEMKKTGADPGGWVKPEIVQYLHHAVHGTRPRNWHRYISERESSRTGSATSEYYSSEARQKAPQLSPEQVASWLAETKTDDVKIIDVKDVCDFADHMILATGRSHRHVFSAASGVCWKVSDEADGYSPRVEGTEGSDWITVDIGSIVVHVFTEAARHDYDLEELWERPGHVQVVHQDVGW